MNPKNARLLSAEEIAGLEDGYSVPKPPEGNEYQNKLLNENAKRCVVKINGDSLFAQISASVISSDEAELETKIGSDVDERYAALIITNGNMESKGKALAGGRRHTRRYNSIAGRLGILANDCGRR